MLSIVIIIIIDIICKENYEQKKTTIKICNVILFLLKKNVTI